MLMLKYSCQIYGKKFETLYTEKGCKLCCFKLCDNTSHTKTAFAAVKEPFHLYPVCIILMFLFFAKLGILGRLAEFWL